MANAVDLLAIAAMSLGIIEHIPVIRDLGEA
jgi:hypothetical protein